MGEVFDTMPALQVYQADVYKDEGADFTPWQGAQTSDWFGAQSFYGRVGADREASVILMYICEVEVG